MSCNTEACKCCETLARINEFFYSVRGATVAHIMTGEMFVAYSNSTRLENTISFTADFVEEAIEGALQQWEAIKDKLPGSTPGVWGGPIVRLDPPATDQHLHGSNDDGHKPD